MLINQINLFANNKEGRINRTANHIRSGRGKGEVKSIKDRKGSDKEAKRSRKLG